VTAGFGDGSSVTGDLVVGCDGAKSIVRELLVGEDVAQVVPTDIHMFNLTCSYSAETAKFLRMRHPILKNSYHPDFNTMFLLTIQDVPDPSAPETWKYQLFMSWSGEPRPEDFPDQASRTAFFKSRAEHWAEPWRTAAREMPGDITFSTDRCTIWTPSSSWSGSLFAGVVTIAGDAAHPMAPHRGQGLNNALQDATHLVEQMQAVAAGNKTLTDAVQAYEDEMRPRAVEEIPISLKQAQMVHNFDTLMQSPMVKLGLHKAREAEKIATAATTTNDKAEGNGGVSTAVSA
jgi:2-polyprenyl-6-methoxyphenol hydroxylase-like FAD-dependent oxidoreductase